MFNKKLTISKYKTLIIVSVFLAFFGAILLASVSHGKQDVYAAKQKEITVRQVSETIFCGREYVDINGKFLDTDTETDTFDNDLFSSLEFSLEGQPIVVGHDDITVDVIEPVYMPKKYVLPFSIVYEGETYSVKTASFAVKKKTVTIVTFLNGKTNLTIREGDEITLSYNYQDAVPAHTHQVPYDGYSVTVIDSAYLNVPAWADIDTTKPVERTRVAAAHAESDYYDFKYAASFLTITERASTTLTATSTDNVTQLIMVGDFSVLNSVEYTDIGINAASQDYSVISANADTIYKDTGFFNDYEKVGCFSVEVYYNGNIVTERVPATFTVQRSSLDSKRTYKVIALYKSGGSEVLDAQLKEGFLTFYGSDVGDFIIVSKVEGLSITYYVLAIAGGLGVLIVVILLISIFRRKY